MTISKFVKNYNKNKLKELIESYEEDVPTWKLLKTMAKILGFKSVKKCLSFVQRINGQS